MVGGLACPPWVWVPVREYCLCSRAGEGWSKVYWSSQQGEAVDVAEDVHHLLTICAQAISEMGDKLANKRVATAADVNGRYPWL